MRDERARDALLAALEADPADAVALAALADWSEEGGDADSAAALRWAARNRRRPGVYPGPGPRVLPYGEFFWLKHDGQPILKDPLAELPAPLWVALEGNDEKEPVASYKSYKTVRSALAALAAAWARSGPAADLA